MNKTQLKFLIGGRDLEMLEISKLLAENNLTVFDHNLSWDNAKLSSYSNELNNNDYFVGIELTEDIPRPSQYKEIDHHNHNASKAASLLQIIVFLNKELDISVAITRDIELIAANDSGYIPAMEAIQATKEEIENIRKRDRKAQGVTAADEKLGEQSINESKTFKNGITVIKSLTPKFSTITDRLFPYERLLIYTDNELTYYGAGASVLAEEYAHLIHSKQAYSGGGENGYFGIANYSINKTLIETILNTIHMNPLSSHIFMFPFKFGNDSLKKDDNSNPRELFIKHMNPILSDNDTTDNKFEWKSLVEDATEKYNQLKYFHEFTHPVLFEDERKIIQSFEIKTTLTYKIEINKKIIDDEEYTPNILNGKKKNKDKKDRFETIEIDLNIEKVTLDLYEHGVGIFSFHLDYYPSNSVKSSDLLNNVLLINQYGRRMYPPFLDTEFIDFNSSSDATVTDTLNGTKHRILAKSIKILINHSEIITTDWKCYSKPTDKKCSLIPNHILYFLNLKQIEDTETCFSFNNINDTDKNQNFTITPILDDRMFVMCWLGARQLEKSFIEQKMKRTQEKKDYGYIVSDICTRVNGGYEASGFSRNNLQHKLLAINKSNDGYGYSNNDFWYQYVFVDNSGKTCQNDIMQNRLIENHTYDRWINYNTLYGISRYSFVILTTPIDSLKKANAAFITTHFRTIYFRMVSLVLIQRTLILKYSKDINNTYAKGDKENTEALKDYPDYLEFINKYFHREITTQEQGIELYDMLIEHLRVESQAKELEKEYQNLFTLKNLEIDKERSKRMKVFTTIGTLFAIPTLFINLSNSTFFSEQSSWVKTGIFLITVMFSTSLILYGLLHWREESKLVKLPKFDRSLWIIITGFALMIMYLILNKIALSCGSDIGFNLYSIL